MSRLLRELVTVIGDILGVASLWAILWLLLVIGAALDPTQTVMMP